MTALLGLFELLMRAGREAKSDDCGPDNSESGILEDMDADDDDEVDYEEDEAGG